MENKVFKINIIQMNKLNLLYSSSQVDFMFNIEKRQKINRSENNLKKMSKKVIFLRFLCDKMPFNLSYIYTKVQILKKFFEKYLKV